MRSIVACVLVAGVVGFCTVMWLQRQGGLQLPPALFQRQDEIPKSRVDLYIYDLEKADYSVVAGEVQKVGGPSAQINQVIKTCCSKLAISCPDFHVFLEPRCLTVVPVGSSGRPDEPVFDLSSIADEIVAEKSIIQTLRVLLRASGSSDAALQVAFQGAESNQKIWRHLRSRSCQ
jgi:hypothetical protein